MRAKCWRDDPDDSLVSDARCLPLLLPLLFNHLQPYIGVASTARPVRAASVFGGLRYRISPIIPHAFTLLVVAGRLRRYSQFPWLKRLALAVVARSLTGEQEQYCREVWIAFEMNEDGVMTPAHMRASLRSRGLGATESEAAALVAGLDLNRDGVVTYTEFAAAVMPRLHYLSEAAITDVFGVLDMDHDGIITFPDLQRLVGDDAFAAVVLSASDLDGDGKISLADFLAIISADEAHIL